MKSLKQIVEQLEKCNYQTEDGLHKLEMNAAFIDLKKLAELEQIQPIVINISHLIKDVNIYGDKPIESYSEIKTAVTEVLLKAIKDSTKLNDV